MSQQLDFKKVREFIRLFHYQYSEETLLPEVCDITLYQEKFSERYGKIGNWDFPGRREDHGHSGLKYNQIGQHSLMPIEILHSENPLDVIQSSVRGLRLGERNYVLRQIDNKAESNQVETVPFDEPTHVNFQEWCGKVRKPDHLFLPLDHEFHTTVFEWRQRNDYTLNMGEIAISGQNVVKIHWVPLDSGIEHGYLLSSEGLNLVHKWFGDSPEPSNFSPNPDFDILSENRPLMFYIGDEVIEDEGEDTESFREKVDFLYRIVISELMLERNHALRLNPTKELSSE